VILKFLGHSLVKDAIPPFLSDLRIVKQNQSFIDNMKFGIAAHLSGQKPSNIVMAKDILCTLASSATTSSCRGVAGVLRVKWQNIRKGIDRHVQLDGLKCAFWTNYQSTIEESEVILSRRQLRMSFNNGGRQRPRSHRTEKTYGEG
jgi:hypothetical protein